MLAKVKSFGLAGINGYKIDIETDINLGLPAYVVVGLADAAVKESKERVQSALKNSGLDYPIARLTVNLAPADTRKEGPIYDLAIAAGILSATGQLDYKKTREFAFLGELSLDGAVRKINGLLPILIAAKQLGEKYIIIPADNAREASFIEGLKIYAVKNLTELMEFFTTPANELNLDKFKVGQNSFTEAKSVASGQNDFKFIHGQYTAKRALEIAAAGGHNVLLVGPPGSGKTMLAKAFPGILPDLTFDEALEVTKIHSVAGVLDNKCGIVLNRPIRSPHHTATAVALTGGGANVKPGEISLAHHGVLFLDEFPEYSRYTLETLRQPLEDGVVTISRASGTFEYPANFILLASMNPCPCGNYGSKKRACKCTPPAIHKYLSKLSGPLMDRIDLHVEVDAVDYEDLAKAANSEQSSQIKIRADAARTLQLKRFLGSSVFSNAKMSSQDIKKFCKINSESEALLKGAFDKLKLSARAYTRILKVARTIADLEGSPDIELSHVAEAIQYRSLDNKYWS